MMIQGNFKHWFSQAFKKMPAPSGENMRLNTNESSLESMMGWLDFYL